MHLTKEEEKILEGEEGRRVAKCMRLLVSIGDINGADRLIPIESAQIAGVSYSTIGEAGLKFIEDLATELEVAIPSKLNPAGMDLKKWREMGIPKRYAEKQLRIVKAYEKMGIDPVCTCTPYLFDPPSFGDHLAWSESSAVSYANSVIGAKTNREGGPTALASAVIGKTPRYGLHLKKNRVANLEVKTDFEPQNTSEFSALGLEVGKVAKNRVPLFRFRNVKENQLKALGAAMASTGSVGLYHVKDITPEIDKQVEPEETVYIEKPSFTEKLESIDLIAIGCPHLDSTELSEIASLLKEKVSKPLWIFTSKNVKEKASEAVKKIEEFGGKVLTDTCMVVTPLQKLGFEKILINSGKASTYLPSLTGVKPLFTDTETCLKVAQN